MTAARRPEDRKVVLAGVAGVRDVAALKFVARYLADKDLAEEACRAAYKIATPQKKGDKGLRGKDVSDILIKAMGTTKDKNLRGEIKKYLLSMPRADASNVNQGKRVTTNVPQQGDKAPHLAVDGVSSIKDSGWWGTHFPCRLEVDLEQTARIDAVQIFFYWDDARYYQYTVEVSLDGKKWKTVVDRAKTTEKPTAQGFMHTFEPVDARFTRINILKNSANPAVHLVEFKAFAVGKSPKAAQARPAAPEKGYTPLFNGKDTTGWIGSTKGGYVAVDGKLICLKAKGGNFFTVKEYADFSFKFDFKLEPGANNGLGIRCPATPTGAATAMELQILDNDAPQYAKLDPRQYHGSLYATVAAKRGHQKPVGEWNSQEVIAKGTSLKVILNGVTILDTDLLKASKMAKMKKYKYPRMLSKKGRIGFLGHGSRIEFRNLRIKEL